MPPTHEGCSPGPGKVGGSSREEQTAHSVPGRRGAEETAGPEEEGAERRIEARSKDYARISYQLFRRPVTPAGPGAATTALELLPDTSVGREELERAVARLRASQLGQHIEAEINRGRFIRAMLGSLREEATTVLSDVREYARTR